MNLIFRNVVKTKRLIFRKFNVVKKKRSDTAGVKILFLFFRMKSSPKTYGYPGI